MVIRKEYDIKEMQECLDTLIAKVVENDSYSVKIPFILAQEIYDVLEETLRREQKEYNNNEKEQVECLGKYDETHVTCKYCNLSEMCRKQKEDRTQTNEIEMYNEHEMPNCIGMYSEKGNQEYCNRCVKELLCKIIEENKRKCKKEETLPDCFGSFCAIFSDGTFTECANTNCSFRERCMEISKGE